MTSATEKLRRLLDERGLEWRKWTKKGKRGFTSTETIWFVPYSLIGSDEHGGFFAKASSSSRHIHLKSIVASPEQAIAATLGSGTCPFAQPTDLTDGCAALERIAELEELGSGTLTAEQVREAWTGNLKRDCLYDPPIPDWQAIADELNATTGSGTCHIEERSDDWYCDACGEMVGTCDTASELYIDGNAIELWNFCPNCGARVVSADE